MDQVTGMSATNGCAWKFATDLCTDCLIDCAKDKLSQISIESASPERQRAALNADHSSVVDDSPFHLIGAFHGPVSCLVCGMKQIIANVCSRTRRTKADTMKWSVSIDTLSPLQFLRWLTTMTGYHHSRLVSLSAGQDEVYYQSVS